MKNKKGMLYALLLMTCLVIGLSYGAFIFSTDKYSWFVIGVRFPSMLQI